MHLFDLASCCECFLILHQSNLLYINKTKVVYMLSSPTCIILHLLSPVTTVNSQKPSGVPCHRNGRGAVGELASQAQPGPSRTRTTCSARARGSLPGAVASLRGRLELVACYSWHEANEFSGKRNQTQSSSVALLRASCVALINSAKMCTVSEDPFRAFFRSFFPANP